MINNKQLIIDAIKYVILCFVLPTAYYIIAILYDMVTGKISNVSGAIVYKGILVVALFMFAGILGGIAAWVMELILKRLGWRKD